MPKNAKATSLSPLERDSVRIVNGYSLLEELGRGGTAIAYKAEKDGSVYCVREHRFGRMPNDDAFKAHELFEREAEVLQKLDHPMIPTVYDLFDFGDGSNFSIYMVQQLMPGQCLQSLIESEGVFSEEQAVDLALPVVDVLKYIHSQTPSVVHKDVKPSNIMYDSETGDVSLIDFGILQQAFLETVGGSTTFGTVGYSAPEVFFGQASTKSDLYSLGPTLLNLVSGLEPHNLLEGVQINYQDKFRFKNDSLELLVNQLIQFNPDSRPKSADEVVDYLQKIKAGKTLSKPRVNTGKVKKFFASLIPDSWFRFLIRDRAKVVEEEQRNNGLLVASTQNSIASYPLIEAAIGEAWIEHTDEFRIYHNVPMLHKDGKNETLVVTKDLLFDGKALRQEEYVRELQGRGIYLMTAPEYLSWAAYLNANQDHPDKEQKKLFAQDRKWLKYLFGKHWLVTGTRPCYKNDGSGLVTQGIGRPGEYQVKAPRLVGPDGWLNKLEDSEEFTRAIFETTNVTYLNDTFRELPGKNSYACRMNHKPSKERELPVVLGSNVYLFNILADGSHYFDYGRRALGVVTQGAENSPSEIKVS